MKEINRHHVLGFIVGVMAYALISASMYFFFYVCAESIPNTPKENVVQQR